MRLVTALVTGGTGHLGGAVVRAFRALGLETHFTFWQQRSRADVLAADTGAKATRLDATSEAEIDGFFDALPEPPRYFVHCVGAAENLRLEALDAAAWQRAFEINVLSTCLCCRAAAQHMRAFGQGSIVVPASMASAKSVPVPAQVGMSAGARAGFVRALAKEVGDWGVRVNLVALGVLGGGFSADIDPRVREDYERFSAMRRLGTAAEAANTIVGIATRAPYMTGAVVSVDGGI